MRWPIEDVPVRSLLFVPGNDPRKIRKSWTTGADGLIFDLEDAVPESAKAEARENLRLALEAASGAHVPAFVRINSPRRTSYWQADVKAVVGRNLCGLVVPKCESPRDLASVDGTVARRERVLGLPRGTVRLLLLIESARGLLEAPHLVGSSRRVVALLFGAEDFCLDMGIARIVGGDELLYARSYLAICARAFGCLAIDSIQPDFNDLKALFKETQACQRLGFSGKLAIHPKQVAPINSAFAPSRRELSEAKEVLRTFAEAKAKGLAVAALRGRMIDKPLVERVRQIVALAESRGRN